MKVKKIGIISFIIILIICSVIFLLSKTNLAKIGFNKWLLYFCGIALINIEYIIVKFSQRHKISKLPLMINGKNIILMILVINLFNILLPKDNALDTVTKEKQNNYEEYRYRLSEDFSYVEQYVNYKRIFLDNERGNILIKDSKDNSIKIEAKVSIDTNDQEVVKPYLQNPISVEKSNNIVVRAHQLTLGEEIVSKPTINYIMYLPKDLEIEISGGQGDINISFIESDILIKKNNGNVKISLIKGDVDISNSYGRVDLSEIEGNVIVDNQHGKITAYNITGTGSFRTTFKPIEIEKIGERTLVDTTNAGVTIIDAQSDVEVSTTFGRAELSDITGNIKVHNNNGDVYVSRINGTVDILTSFGMVKVNEVYHNVKAITSHEDVVVTLDKELSSNFRLETNYSDIYFFSPDIENARLDLFTAQYGVIEGDYVLNIKPNGDELSCNKVLGVGDYTLKMKNFNGNIFIRKR